MREEGPRRKDRYRIRPKSPTRFSTRRCDRKLFASEDLFKSSDYCVLFVYIFQ